MYDLEGNLLQQIASLPLDANHFGDIGYYDYEGQLYKRVEWFDARGQDIQILLCDAGTLDYSGSVPVTWNVDSVPWNADSGQVECSPITIDVEIELVWMLDWVKSNCVYKYDLHSGK